MPAPRALSQLKRSRLSRRLGPGDVGDPAAFVRRDEAADEVAEGSRVGAGLDRASDFDDAGGRRPASVCKVCLGVRPVKAAAMAEGPPSRFVRAPSTELAKQTAEDSAQATCRPNFGAKPT